MANEAEKFGLPQIIINFRTKSVTAIARKPIHRTVTIRKSHIYHLITRIAGNIHG